MTLRYGVTQCLFETLIGQKNDPVFRAGSFLPFLSRFEVVFINLLDSNLKPYGSLSELELYIEQGRVCMSGVMNRQGLTEYPEWGKVQCSE